MHLHGYRDYGFRAWRAWALVALITGPALPAEQISPSQRQALPRHFGFGPVEIFKLDERIGPLQVADFNGDGLNDLAVANNYKSTIEILLQRREQPEEPEPAEGVNDLTSGWRFDRKRVSVVWEIQSLAVADVTGDRCPDLVFFGDPPELVVVPSRGDGTFGEPIARRVTGGLGIEEALACGDLNGDGRADVVLLAADDVLVFFQTDDGRLAEPERFAHAVDSPLLVEASDLDGDGLDDLAIFHRSDEHPLQLRFQTAAHQLGPTLRIKLPRLRSLHWASCLGRRQTDLFCIEEVSGRLKRWTFDPRSSAAADTEAEVLHYPLPATARQERLPLAVGDVDGNGLTDVVVADAETAELLLFRQGADLGLMPEQRFGGPLKIRNLCTFDVDGNGQDEVYVLSAEEQNIAVSRYVEGRLTFPRPIPIAGTPQAMDVGVLGGPSPRAVVVYVYSDAEETYRFGVADLGGDPPADRPDEAAGLALDDLDTPPDAVRLVDINHDGRTDALLFVPYEPLMTLLQQPDGSIALMSGDGGGQKGLVKRATVAGSSFADIDGDGHLELLLAQKTFVRALQVGPGDAWEVVDQFNAPSGDAEITGVTVLPSRGDSSDEDSGAGELAMYNKRSRQVHLFKPAAAGQYTLDRSIAVGAFDLKVMTGVGDGGSVGDPAPGEPSLLLADPKRFAVVLPERPATAAHEAAVYETSIRDGYLTHQAVGDLNHDGRTDLAVIEASDHFVEILTFGPDGGLVRATKFRVFAKKQFRRSGHEAGGEGEPRAVHVADLTGDGYDDLLLIAHDRLLLYPGQ